jgi:3'-phosphoadenosine 5'-phosphosulfate sulfotransferase (PAPS reductase)/FAD synthetase
MADDTKHAVDETERVKRSLALIDQAIEEHNPVAILGLFSGGHDSLTAVHVGARHYLFDAAVHINTGIGVPATRQFVRETCAEQGWTLREYRAKEDCGQDYAEMVRKHGFPGPGQHSTMYIRLKERALRLAIRDAKKGRSRRSRVLLLSGVRFQESDRRMGYQEPIVRQGAYVWLNIINDWSKADCGRYLENNKIRRSPVVDMIHKSGECLCGAFAKKGEFEELKFWFPEVAAEIQNMPSGNGKCWGWGSGDDSARPPSPGPLCVGCSL